MAPPPLRLSLCPEADLFGLVKHVHDGPNDVRHQSSSSLLFAVREVEGASAGFANRFSVLSFRFFNEHGTYRRTFVLKCLPALFDDMKQVSQSTESVSRQHYLLPL